MTDQAGTLQVKKIQRSKCKRMGGNRGGGGGRRRMPRRNEASLSLYVSLGFFYRFIITKAETSCGDFKLALNISVLLKNWRYHFYFRNVSISEQGYQLHPQD